ncbi:MBL fold metallo-hydrolase [Streptomyces phaeochromogenes]|uniref:MBL fold metallo-hydrolase n=1 Tax=Streptomyces phaeochromogenes TaxID=1923 RepID=UPI003715BCDC
MATSLKAASRATAQANRAALERLAFDDVRDFEDVRSGLIAELPHGGVIRDAAGDLLWDLAWFSFVETGEPAPDFVHPSLWRQSQLITGAGLYKVSDRIYQVRNHGLANVTTIEGDGGLIVVDTGSKAECAKFAMDLDYANRPERLLVVAVIYTHTHIDHYGGITGIVSPEDVAAGKVAILAPGENFEKYALGENVVCGNVMSRRPTSHPATIAPARPPRPQPRARCRASPAGTAAQASSLSHPTRCPAIHTPQVLALDDQLARPPRREAAASLHVGERQPVVALPRDLPGRGPPWIDLRQRIVRLSESSPVYGTPVSLSF